MPTPLLWLQGIAPTDASAAAAAGAAATSDASAAFTAEGEPSDSAAAAIVTDGLQTSPARLYQLQCDLHARLTMLGRSVKAQQARRALLARAAHAHRALMLPCAWRVGGAGTARGEPQQVSGGIAQAPGGAGAEHAAYVARVPRA